MIEIYKHKPVLLERAINGLNIRSDGIYIDGTFGCGGHSQLILSKLGRKGRLLAIDRDPKAVSIAKTICDPRFSIIHGPFSKLNDYVIERKLSGMIDGILLDLGVSSPQIDDAKRGFSFMMNGPLDMRMDQTKGQSAAEWLNNASENDIAWVIKTFGEERFNKRIARAIIKYNRIKPITHTKELVKIIMSAIPIRDKYKHPATRTFQAVRIWINNELEEIKLVLKSAIDVLSLGGRLVTISFNSLEDRIIKKFMQKYSHNSHISTDFVMEKSKFQKINNCHLKIIDKLVSRKKKIEDNPRARSSILRIAERVNM